MEPKELTEARSLLKDYDKDNRKVNKLKLGLYSLYSVIEGKYEEKYINIAKNILNAYRINILEEANNLLLNPASINLGKVEHLRKRIDKFLEADFDDNSELNDFSEKLKMISLELSSDLTQKQIKELEELLELFDK